MSNKISVLVLLDFSSMQWNLRQLVALRFYSNHFVIPGNIFVHTKMHTNRFAFPLFCMRNHFGKTTQLIKIKSKTSWQSKEQKGHKSKQIVYSWKIKQSSSLSFIYHLVNLQSAAILKLCWGKTANYVSILETFVCANKLIFLIGSLLPCKNG